MQDPCQRAAGSAVEGVEKDTLRADELDGSRGDGRRLVFASFGEAGQQHAGAPYLERIPPRLLLGS